MSPWDVVISAMLLTSLAMCIAYFVIWRSLGRAPHALTWALSYGNGVIYFGIQLADLRWFKITPIAWPLLNFLGVFGAVLSTIGYWQRSGFRTRSPIALAFWFMCLSIAVAAGFLDRNVGLRLAAVPLLCAVILPLGAWAIARGARGALSTSEWFAIAVLSAFSLLELGGGAAALMQGSAGNARWLDLYLAVLFLGLPAMYATAGMGGALLIASDMADEMGRMAMTDVLTGLFNRRGFERETDAAIASNGGFPISLIVSDIDFFKQINDRHGHPGVDQALQRFAALSVIISPAPSSAAPVARNSRFWLVWMSRPPAPRRTRSGLPSRPTKPAASASRQALALRSLWKASTLPPSSISPIVPFTCPR